MCEEYLLDLNLLEEYSNIILKNQILNFEKTLNIGIEINYASIINIENRIYIYYRNTINKEDRINGEQTERFIINDDLTIKKENYILKLGIASHNFRLFEFNNEIFGVGGQSLGIKNYNIFDKKIGTNKAFIDYHKNKKVVFIDKNKYGIGDLVGSHIYSPNHICPYFGNGLHLFRFPDIRNNTYNILNNKLPIISGIKINRHDGHYGYCDNKNIIKSKNGLTVFDSNTSILFNTINKKYYLYQRANIGLGIRYIQYCISTNLINWSDWNLVCLKPSKNYFNSNYYINNFFKIKNVNNYIGILFHNKKISSAYNGLNNNGNIELYYSNNCERWNFMGNIGTFSYHNEWIIAGEPYIKDNKHYYFIVNNSKKQINLFYIDKNRYTYIENNNLLESDITFNIFHIKDNIIINFNTTKDGYLKFQLLDNNKNIINNFSFDNFDTIQGENNLFEYELKWNNSSILNLNEKCYIQLKGLNFKLFSIKI